MLPHHEWRGYYRFVPLGRVENGPPQRLFGSFPNLTVSGTGGGNWQVALTVSAAVAADGQLIATACRGGDVKIWDAATYALVTTLRLAPAVAEAGDP